jgi:Papain-like cysteine protease AvrRpt2
MFRNIGGLQIRRVPVASAAAPGTVPGTVKHILPTFMQYQQQSNWCWSACGTSVGLFFETGNWTQCGTATALIRGTSCYKGQPLDCCKSPSSCNCYGYLDASLKYTLTFNSMLSGKYDANNIQTQINMGRPVCVRVAWTGGGAHFLAITGYSYPNTSSPSNFTIYLQDPIYGSSSMLLSNFPSKYHGGGTWTTTFLTQPTSN